MKRLQEQDRPKKEKKETAQAATPKPIVQTKRAQAPLTATRQMSEGKTKTNNPIQLMSH